MAPRGRFLNSEFCILTSDVSAVLDRASRATSPNLLLHPNFYSDLPGC